MDLIEKAHIKLSFTDNYLSFILGGISLQSVDTPITYMGTTFIMAILYDAFKQEFILQYNLEEIEKKKWGVPEVVALLQHELGHVLANHFSRQEDREPIRWNVAGDYALDQHIPNIPRNKRELEMIKKKYPAFMAEEIYYQLPVDTKAPETIFLIVNSQTPMPCPQCGGKGHEECPDCEGTGKTECKDCKGSGKDEEGNDCGGCAGEGDQECETCQGKGQQSQPCPMCGGKGQVQSQPCMLPREEVGGAVDKLVKETTGQDLKDIAYGNQAGIWETIRKSFESDEIDWRLIPKYLASFRDKVRRTLKKPSRRFPSPWGKRKEYQPKMTICVDCSGSIDDVELDAFMAEIDRLTMITGEIKLLFCDCSVHKTLERYKAHQKIGGIPGRGGTDYDPALKYVNDNWRDTDLIVYLTDGECHPPRRKYRIPVIWIVTRNFNLGVKPMIKAPGLSKRSGGGW